MSVMRQWSWLEASQKWLKVLGYDFERLNGLGTRFRVREWENVSLPANVAWLTKEELVSNILDEVWYVMWTMQCQHSCLLIHRMFHRKRLEGMNFFCEDGWNVLIFCKRKKKKNSEFIERKFLRLGEWRIHAWFNVAYARDDFEGAHKSMGSFLEMEGNFFFLL